MGHHHSHHHDHHTSGTSSSYHHHHHHGYNQHHHQSRQRGRSRTDSGHPQQPSSPPPPAVVLELASRLVDLSFVHHPAGVSRDCISRAAFCTHFVADNAAIGGALFEHFCRGCLPAVSSSSMTSTSLAAKGAELGTSTTEGLKSSASFCRRSDAVSVDGFVGGCQCVLLLMSDAEQVEFYLRAFAGMSCQCLPAATSDQMDDVAAAASVLSHDDVISREQLRVLVVQAYETAMWTSDSSSMASANASARSSHVDTILTAVADSCMHARRSVSVAYAHSWLLRHCPRLLKWLHRWVVHRITSGGGERRRSGGGLTDVTLASSGSCVLDSASASSVASIHPALLWLLMCSLPELYTRQHCAHSLPSVLGLAHLDPDQFIARMLDAMTPRHWVSLYSSDDQGLSASRFEHLVMTYHGPTITLLRADFDHLFCVAVDVGWRDSPHYWGGAECMTLQLLPNFQVLCQGEADMVYHNVTSRGMATGIRVGRDRKTPVLSVNRDLSRLEHSGIPLTLCGIEVWGCGDSQARDRQLHSQKREITRVEQRRQVNLMADTSWNDNPDKYLLELSGARQSYNYS